MKKIIVFSTGDVHGAYEAAYRIAKFLYNANYKVALMVRNKTKRDAFIIQVPLRSRTITHRLYNKLFPEKINIATDAEYLFLNPNEKKEYVPVEDIMHKMPFVPDLIWVGMTDNFINTDTLAILKQRTNAKIYMQMMDMEPITGGCHYAWDCKGYEMECHSCPAILDKEHKEQAHKNLINKIRNVEKAEIGVIAGSGWTYEQAKKSTLFKNQHKIYNTNSLIDTSLFNSKNRSVAKRIFDIPMSSKVIFTGSWFTNDKRKGMVYFVEALNHLWTKMDISTREEIYVMIAGEHVGGNEFIERIPFKIHLMDFIKDYRLLSLAYQASDVFVCASIEDSGPMMVSEALACGTPVVGFDMGVVHNMVKSGFNGYKAILKDSEDLAYGMNQILALKEEEFNEYPLNAVEQVEKYSSQNEVIKIIDDIFSNQ